MSRTIEHICRNCRLYDTSNGLCRVVILHEGERINLPMEPDDPCFFEQTCQNPDTKDLESFNEIKEVRFWVEDEKGERTNKNGTVKMEYPKEFFGEYTIDDIV